MHLRDGFGVKVKNKVRARVGDGVRIEVRDDFEIIKRSGLWFAGGMWLG